MAIKVQIPTPMRDQSDGQAEVIVVGDTVQAALDDLVRQFPGLGTKLFDKGKLRPFVNVLIGEEDIRYLDDVDTKLTDGSVVLLMPAVSGG